MENNTLLLAKATPADIKELQELSSRTFIETYAEFNTQEDMEQYLETQFSLEKLASDIKDPASDYYFALENGKAAGYIKVNFATAQTDINDPDSLELERIYVLKEHQGKKIGQYLLDAARTIAVQNNLEYLWLGVWDQNVNAREFYAKSGFIQFGTHTFLLGEDEQYDLLLKLSLR